MCVILALKPPGLPKDVIKKGEYPWMDTRLDLAIVAIKFLRTA
jgi:hypothetical protein